MEVELSENGEHTVGWWCGEHGLFLVECPCGTLAGQPHDVLCKKLVGHDESVE